MNENDPVENDENDDEAKKGLLAGGAAAIGGVGGLAKGAMDKAKGVAASAKDGVAGAADSASGATNSASGAAAGIQDGASSVVAGGAAASAAVTGSVSSNNDEGAAVVAGASATAAAVGGATAQAGGGSGGSGTSGGSGSGSDDDEDKLIPVAPVSGDNQIVILGLIVAFFMFFGGAVWAFLGFGDDGGEVLLGDADAAEIAELEELSPECAAIFTAFEDSDALEEDDYENITCSSNNGEVTLDGEVENSAVQSSVAGVAAGVTVAGAAIDLDSEEVFVVEEEVEEVEVEVEEEEVEEVAAEVTTTTTEAPVEETTTTTEAPAAEPFTMWDALTGSQEAVQFSVIGGALGLQEDLEALEDADGNPVMRTLFAPSDAALAELGPEGVGALSADPNAAAALVGYHFLEESLTAEDLIALDGESVTTRTQLPLNIEVVDGQVVLNGTSVVVSSDFTADNGIVHIVDTVLQPPTLNEVLQLENIEFDPAQATITAAGQATLGAAVDFFTANPTATAVIEGHTDTDGSDELNAALSQDRADAVRQFLIDGGVDGENLTATGFGESQPVLVDGVEDKEASRRIEFVLQ